MAFPCLRFAVRLILNKKIIVWISLCVLCTNLITVQAFSQNKTDEGDLVGAIITAEQRNNLTQILLTGYTVVASFLSGIGVFYINDEIRKRRNIRNSKRSIKSELETVQSDLKKYA